MTREEAISIMKVIVHMLEEKYDTDRVEESVDMAIKALEQEPCDKCVYSTKNGECQYDDIAEVIPTEETPCDDFLSREERLKMLMGTGEFDFLKDIPPDKIWKLVFMLEFIGDAESEDKG